MTHIYIYILYVYFPRQFPAISDNVPPPVYKHKQQRLRKFPTSEKKKRWETNYLCRGKRGKLFKFSVNVSVALLLQFANCNLMFHIQQQFAR
jgi:hypothetical protein